MPTGGVVIVRWVRCRALTRDQTGDHPCHPEHRRGQVTEIGFAKPTTDRGSEHQPRSNLSVTNTVQGRAPCAIAIAVSPRCEGCAAAVPPALSVGFDGRPMVGDGPSPPPPPPPPSPPPPSRSLRPRSGPVLSLPLQRTALNRRQHHGMMYARGLSRSGVWSVGDGVGSVWRAGFLFLSMACRPFLPGAVLLPRLVWLSASPPSLIPRCLARTPRPSPPGLAPSPWPPFSLGADGHLGSEQFE